MSDEGPRYPHYCPNCRWLGRVGNGNENADAYICSGDPRDHLPFPYHKNIPSLLFVRDSGSKTWASLNLAPEDISSPVIGPAYKLAIAKGYMTPDGEFIPPSAEWEQRIANLQQELDALRDEVKALKPQTDPMEGKRYVRNNVLWIQDGKVMVRSGDKPAVKTGYTVESFKAAIKTGEFIPLDSPADSHQG